MLTVLHNTWVGFSFLIRLEPETCNFIKKVTLTWVLFCEFCKTFKNLFYRTPPVKSLISVFQESFASIKKIIKLPRRLSPRVTFYEVLRLSSVILEATRI